MSRYAKALVALGGAVAQLAVVAADAQAQGLIPPDWQPWVQIGLAIATAAGVYQIPNQRPGRHALGAPAVDQREDHL